MATNQVIKTTAELFGEKEEELPIKKIKTTAELFGEAIQTRPQEPVMPRVEMPRTEMPKWWKPPPLIETPEEKEAKIKIAQARPLDTRPLFERVAGKKTGEPTFQFLYNLGNTLGFGLPGVVAKKIPREAYAKVGIEKETIFRPPETAVQQVAAGAGSLIGFIGGPAKIVGGAVAKIPLFAKKAKGILGIVQNIGQHMTTLAVASGLIEHKGGTIPENVKNRFKALQHGAVIGSIFGAGQFIGIAGKPILSTVMRLGIGTTAIDMATGVKPWDERELLEKVYHYGLNAWFLRHGRDPRLLMQARKLEKEVSAFAKQAKEEKIDVKLIKPLEFMKPTGEQPKTRMEQLDEMIKTAKPEMKSELQKQRLALGEQLRGIEEPTTKKTEELEFKEPLKKPVEKRMPSYPGFPREAPDIWYRVMEHGGIKRPKFEIEEFEGNVPKQLRRETGLKPDDMAERLGLEDTNQLYDKLERMGVERVVEKPAEEIRLEHEEFLAKEPAEQRFLKTETDILKETGYKSPEIQRFLENEFLDGTQLRATVNDVISGKVKKPDAVAEIKGLIESVVGKPPAEPELFKEKIIEERIEKMPTQKELETEGTSSAITGLPLAKTARVAMEKMIDVFQVEPQFRRANAPDTGLAFKTYHSKINGELIATKVAIKEVSKTKLSRDEFKELIFVSARPGKFWKMDKEKRARFSPAYQAVRKFFDGWAEKLEKRGIITEPWPQSAIRRMEETREAHLKGLSQGKFDPGREVEIRKEIQDLTTALDFLQKTRAQYVPIPRAWFEAFFTKKPGDAPGIINEFFKQRKVYDIEELSRWLVEKKYVKSEDMDIRIVMAQYAHSASKKLALADILNSAKREGLIRDESVAPERWQYLDRKQFPTLRGQKVSPMFADFFEKNLTAKKLAPLKMGRVLGTIKMLQFYNPAFLPMYDVVQAFWAGSVMPHRILIPTKKNLLYQAFKAMKNKDEGYWDAHFWGAFSTPFTPHYEGFMKDVRASVGKNPFFKTAMRYVVNPYRISWELAWGGDKFIRLMTYNHYINNKGFSPKDAAQTTAKLHADYAGVPRSTRKWLNRIFFTPSFKIAMASAQLEMVKSSGKYLTAAAGVRKPVSAKEKAMTRAFVGLVSGILIRGAIMKALGFEEDKWGLKYSKEITTEEGERKELVLHTASPDNVFQRYYHRFTNIPTNPDAVGAWFSRIKWDLHPLWQLGIELWSNRNTSFEPIVNLLDPTWKIMKDRALYTIKRLVRVTEQIGGLSESPKRLKAQHELSRDLGKLSWILNLFVLPYTRSPREQRAQFQINELIGEFKRGEREKPARSMEEMKRREDNLRRKIQKITKELEGIK